MKTPGSRLTREENTLTSTTFQDSQLQDSTLLRPAPVGPRLLAPDRRDPSLAAHLARHGTIPFRGGPQLLIGTVQQSGLTGRGGAAFPTHRKMSAVAAGTRPVVVANAAEGEPAAYKDSTLLNHAPHLVLDGLQLAAEAVGSREVYLYLHRHPGLVAAMERALADRSASGMDKVKVRVVTAPKRFLSGEESALVSRIEGGAALPRAKPPGIYESGVRGRATLVQNIETLAQLALIARYGATWFRHQGTADEPGSMLTTIHESGHQTFVVEAELGTPIADLFHGLTAGTQALLVGGYHGAWISINKAAGLRLLNADLRVHGAALGAGVLAALPAGRCGLAESARVMTYLALESAGQCGPCLNGLPRIAAALEQLARPTPAPGLVDDVSRWCGLVEGRGACHHPDGSTRFVRSALTVFHEELQAHVHGYCTGRSATAFLPIPDSAKEREWR